MGYWSTIDKNQKQIESNTARINQLTEKLNELEKQERVLRNFAHSVTEKLNELEKQERALTKIAELNADDIQDIQQENSNLDTLLRLNKSHYIHLIRELEFRGILDADVEEAEASQVVVDEVLSDCFQDLKVLCSSKTRTIKDNSNARFVNINNVIDIINKYSNSNKGRI